MTSRRKVVIGGVFGFLAGLALVGPYQKVAYGETNPAIEQRAEEADTCSSGVKCGDTCCNNSTDKCCKGSCIGERDSC